MTVPCSRLIRTCFNNLLVTVLWQLLLVRTIQCGANNLHILADGVSTSEIIGGDVFFEIIDPPELEYTFRLRPAKNFGGIFNSSTKLDDVNLVLADPEDACTKVHNWEEMYGNVALVERGDCSFLEKALQVQKAGASAVIITDSAASEDELSYYIDMVDDNTGRDVYIPAGYLQGMNGQMIRRTLNKLGQMHAIINIPVNLTFVPPHEINHPPWQGW